MPANLENSAVATGLEKVSFHFNPQERQCQRMLKTTTQLLSSPTLVNKCSQFSRPDFSSTWTMNFQILKLVLEKAEEPEIKLPMTAGSLKKQESSRKSCISAYWLCQSLSLCGSPHTVENSQIDGNIRTPDLPLEKSVCRSGSNI